jgi:hypothetical protein
MSKEKKPDCEVECISEHVRVGVRDRMAARAELTEKTGDKIDLLLSDVGMPDMSRRNGC